MEITTERIYNEYKEDIKARKPFLVFIIMLPIMLLISIIGGNIFVGLLIMLALGIYLIITTVNSKNALKEIQKGNYSITIDTIVDKSSHRSSKSTHFYLRSNTLFPSNYSVSSRVYDEYEIGDDFVAVISNHKLIMLYNLKSNTISSESYSKLKKAVIR